MVGISKRGASVGTHGDKDLEQERSPDGRLREALRAYVCTKE